MQRVKSFIQEKLKEVRKNYNTARTAAGYPHYINNADWIKLLKEKQKLYLEILKFIKSQQ